MTTKNQKEMGKKMDSILGRHVVEAFGFLASDFGYCQGHEMGFMLGLQTAYWQVGLMTTDQYCDLSIRQAFRD